MDRTHQHITNQTIYAPVTSDHPFFLLFLPHSIITCPPQHQLSQLVHHNIIHQISIPQLYTFPKRPHAPYSPSKQEEAPAFLTM